MSTSSLPTVIIKPTYSVYRAKLLCWIKRFAIFTNGFQTYFLQASCAIGCVYFHNSRQTEPNRSPSNQICYTLQNHSLRATICQSKVLYFAIPTILLISDLISNQYLFFCFFSQIRTFLSPPLSVASQRQVFEDRRSFLTSPTQTPGARRWPLNPAEDKKHRWGPYDDEIYSNVITQVQLHLHFHCNHVNGM